MQLSIHPGKLGPEIVQALQATRGEIGPMQGPGESPQPLVRVNFGKAKVDE
jgi:hypothetical protein